MKKIFAFILAVVCMFALAACSAKEEGGNTPTEEKFVMQRGSYDADKTYFENKATGLKIRIPDTFSTYTEADLAKAFLSGVTGEELAAWTEEDLKTRTIIPEMAIVNYSNGSNMNIQYENLAAENALSADAETYIKVATSKLGRDSGYNVGEITTDYLGGKEYKAVEVSSVQSGYNISQKLYCRRVDDYITVIVMTELGTDTDFSTFTNLFE